MKREPVEGWQPGYNCPAPEPEHLACHCYATCMYDGSRWHVSNMSQRAGTVDLYVDFAGQERLERTVAISRVTSVTWHESARCEHVRLRHVVDALQEQLEPEGANS